MRLRRSSAARRIFRLAAALTAVAALSTACSSGRGDQASAAPATQDQTAESPTAAQTTPTGEQLAPTAVRTSSTTARPSKTSEKGSTDSTPAMIKVPNGVGLDYQSAQDLWRAAGLHVTPAIDATGAHRLPIIDANWVVLAQDLKAGSKVPVDSFIRATV